MPSSTSNDEVTRDLPSESTESEPATSTTTSLMKVMSVANVWELMKKMHVVGRSMLITSAKMK